MRISRAIGHVRRQAKQGILGLGEGLQSAVVPRPLRGAASRLAELLGAKKATARARKEPTRPHSPAGVVYQPQVTADTPDEVTFTGIDSGLEPNREPRDDTPVDPAVVGAIPTYDATPTEVAPVEVTAIDATPVEVTPVEVTPVEVTPVEVTPIELAPAALVSADALAAVEARPRARERRDDASEATRPLATPAGTPAPTGSKQAARGGSAARNGKKRPAPAGGEAASKEKVAPSEEAAKTLARSGSRGSKKRSGPRADSSSKKK
jgi:hypothetical protein